MSRQETTDTVSKFGAVLAAVEMGLGGVLHAFHVPLAGQILSLNQGFLLSRMVLTNSKVRGVRVAPASVSLIAALLKCLSPAGKKLTPMLAISAQGILFTGPAIVFGANFLGCVVGSLLLSLWAYVQPVLLLTIIYGKWGWHIGEHYLKQFSEVFKFPPERLLYVVLFFVVLKLTIATALVIVAGRLPEEFFSRYLTYLLRAGKGRREALRYQPIEASVGQHVRGALKDMINPLFLISFSLTVFFFIFVDVPVTRRIWLALRPLAIAFLLFFFIRVLPFEKWVLKLKGPRTRAFALALQRAVQWVKSV